eukprot:s2994_g5.t1
MLLAAIGAAGAREEEGSEEVKEWFQLYREARVQGQQDPRSLQATAPEFESVPPSQIIAGVPGRDLEGGVSQHGSGIQSDECRISSMWKPSWLASPESFALPVFVDTQVTLQTMAAQMQSFRNKIDVTFGWAGKVLNDGEVEFRAAVQAVLLKMH